MYTEQADWQEGREREREPLMRKDEAESVREKSIREGERERKEREERERLTTRDE